MATRALDLFRRWSPIVPSLRGGDEAFARAISVIKEIAAAYAILSAPCESAEVPPNVASRAIVESGIRASGVDEWASTHGVQLRLAEATGIDEAWAIEQAQDRKAVSEEQLAETFACMVSAYADVLSGEETPRLSEEDAAELVSVARSWVAWGRGRADPRIDAVAAALSFVAEGLFVWTHDESASLFPTKDFLRDLLSAMEGIDWLEAHEVDLPDWLRATY
jgi:hypothetical protein